MRKTVSIIAASLLTATVVFTGCGGGGSSVTTASSSSSVSSSSSSSVTPTIKTVTVSDGWVLGATVKCKNSDGTDIASGTATAPGTYEIDVTNKACPVLCSKDGYIDVDGSNAIEQGEPKAPRMMAPGTYSNINPFTHLIANGVSAQDLAAATGLDAAMYNNFDIAIPDANSLELSKQAVLLSAAIAYIENQGTVTVSSSSTPSTSINTSSSSSVASEGGILPGGPGVRGILPGGPGSGISNTSMNTSSSSSVASEGGILPGGPGTSASTNNSSPVATTVLTYAMLIERMKNGEKIGDIIPSLRSLENELSNADSPQKCDEIASSYIANNTGACEENVCVAPASGTSSSAAAYSSEAIECLPGQECGGATSSSSNANNGEAIECLPGQECGGATSSSSSIEATNSSTSVSSGQNNTTSYTTSSTEGVLPGGPGA